MRDRLKYVWLLLIAICLFYFYKKNMFFGNPLELRVWLANFGAMTPAIFVILYTLRPILLIPALLLNLMSAALFGPVWGTVYTLLGGLGSATLCYYLARYSKFEFIANVADKFAFAAANNSVLLNLIVINVFLHFYKFSNAANRVTLFSIAAGSSAGGAGGSAGGSAGSTASITFVANPYDKASSAVSQTSDASKVIRSSRVPEKCLR